MRRCFAGDLMTVAEALSALPEALRRRAVQRFLDEAHAAHHYAKRFAKPHPHWGNGSLLTRVLAEPSPDPDWSLVALVATALAEFRNRTYLGPPV